MTRARPASAVLRTLPAVDRVLRRLAADGACAQNDAEAAHLARGLLAAWREALVAGRVPPGAEGVGGVAGHATDAEAAREALTARLASQVGRSLAARRRPAYPRAVNASGIFLHTGLGRAPLADEAAAAVAAIATGFTVLEVDPASGERRHREARLAEDLCALTGAGAATVVNNNAGALLLVLAALAAGRQVVVSRGELVEIGGGFRLPELLAASGARLVEVGTTNRTYARDFEAALGEETALLLRMHTSNFRTIGFTHAPARAELAALAHARGRLLVEDTGSGLLAPGSPAGPFPGAALEGLAHEPDARGALEEGADLVLFSGDKLLGGPQAGVIVGKPELVAACRRHPLFRALRPDRLALAALAATLRLHRENPGALPIARALAADPQARRARAEALAARLRAACEVAARAHGPRTAGRPAPRFEVVESEAQAGSGSLPARALRSAAVEIAWPGLPAEALARRLREGDPAVFPAEARGHVRLDVFALLPGDEQRLEQALVAILESPRDAAPVPSKGAAGGSRPARGRRPAGAAARAKSVDRVSSVDRAKPAARGARRRTR